MGIQDRDYMRRPSEEDERGASASDKADEFLSRFLRMYPRFFLYAGIGLVVLVVIALIVSKASGAAMIETDGTWPVLAAVTREVKVDPGGKFEFTDPGSHFFDMRYRWTLDPYDTLACKELGRFTRGAILSAFCLMWLFFAFVADSVQIHHWQKM